MRDYSRQRMFDQERLRQDRVTIHGTEPITHYLCSYMTGLGITKVRLVGGEEEGDIRKFLGNGCQAIKRKLGMMNKEIEADTVKGIIDNAYIGNTRILAELTNDTYAKQKAVEIFYENDDVPMLALACSSEDCASLRIYRKNDRCKQDISKDMEVMRSYKGKRQGTYTSGIIAAMLLDEIRKEMMPLEGDYILRKWDYCLGDDKRAYPEKLEDKVMKTGKLKLAVVGAGGVGTYAALNAALMDAKVIDIYDGDKIESHNLNRQIFYYDEVGNNKALTLAKRLRLFNHRVRAFPYNVSGRLSGKYDAIMCCVDSWSARRELNKIAKENGMMLVNSAVSAFTAKTEICVPGKGPCLETRYEFDRLMKHKEIRKGCASVTESNVVMTNAFAGAFMAAEIKAAMHPKAYHTSHEKEARYSSKNPARRRLVLIDAEKNKQG